MNIAIEEDVEDAVVAFVKGKLPGECDVRPAYEGRPTKYPCVCVAVVTNANADGDLTAVCPRRKLAVEVQLLTELKDVTDKDGKVEMTIREQCKILRRAVTRILSSPTIAADLNASPNIEFGTCFMGEIRRGLGGNEIESTIPLEMIAVARNQGD